jgi:hypothetical protein
MFERHYGLPGRGILENRSANAARDARFALEAARDRTA